MSTFGVRRSTLRPHHASATGAALASSSTSGGFQDGHPGLPVTAYLAADSQLYYCFVYEDRCFAVFCSCRSETVEQPSS